MEGGQNAGSDFKGGFDSVIYEKNSEENPPYLQSTRQKVSMLIITPERRYRLAAVFLALLAAVLFIVDIGLGVHYNRLTDSHLTLLDAELIGKELENLQFTYKAAVKNTTEAREQLEKQRNNQKEDDWEFEHQTKMSTNYQEQIAKITKDVDTMRSHLPMIHGGCKHCSPGWILMNSICYYFPFSNKDGLKSWHQAREFCKINGGDLAIIDTKDKQKTIINHLVKHTNPSLYPMSFWIGLIDQQEEGTWKWIDGKHLTEAYWNDGEPNDMNDEDCVQVSPRENFFQAWNDARCSVSLRWICEKASTLTE